MPSINPYTVISAVLNFFPDEQFQNDREKLHSAFYQVREKHRDLLGELGFRKNLLFPRSRLLDDVLSSLQPEFLGKMNPSLDTYHIKRPRLKKLWDEDLKSVLSEKESEIKEIAGELCRILKTP